MASDKEKENAKGRELTLEGALEMVDSGYFTNLLAATGGLITLAAMASTQAMYYILPAIRCEFALGSAELGILASVGFIGSMLSASWFGFLVDMYGRRRILLITTVGTTVSSIIGSLAPNTPTLMASIFSTGFMLGGVLGNPYVYVSEFCAPRIRSDKLIIIAIVASLSNTFSPCVAWLVMWLDIYLPIAGVLEFTSWRMFLLLNTLPMLLSSVLLYHLPESPKYLLSRGRQADALSSLARVFAANHHLSKQHFPVDRLRLEVEDVQGLGSSKSGGFLHFLFFMCKQVKELFTPPLLVYTCICSAMKFAVIGLYSVIYLWLPEEANRLLKYSTTHSSYQATLCDVMSMEGYDKWGKCAPSTETYLVAISVGLVYFLLSLLMIYLVRVARLKIILGSSILLTAGICFVMLFFRSLFPVLISLGLMTAVLAAAQPAVYAIVVYFFPTSLRATATAVCVVFGRLAVPIGSSLFGAAFHSHCVLAYSTLAVVLAVVAVICFVTPEKKNESPGNP